MNTVDFVDTLCCMFIKVKNAKRINREQRHKSTEQFGINDTFNDKILCTRRRLEDNERKAFVIDSNCVMVFFAVVLTFI